ncbi:MAG TPA: hypothetical protein VMZ22_12115 [Acidimicrobiales bacterium]|nr:hypothetical protein [Acidimicrobiales bacterium]
MAPRKSYLLRLSPQLYAELERWAADELRSVNAQIEFLLTDAVRRAGRRNPPAEAGPPDADAS